MLIIQKSKMLTLKNLKSLPSSSVKTDILIETAPSPFIVKAKTFTEYAVNFSNPEMWSLRSFGPVVELT